MLTVTVYSYCMSISTEQLTSWYVSDRLPVAEIAERAGMSRAGVWKRLTRAQVLNGETKRRVPPALVSCATCRATVLRARFRVKRSRRQFCSNACYVTWLSNEEYQGHRQGQRIARKVVGQFFILLEGYVVHHCDSHNDHNEPINLMVFASQSDHLAWHHGNQSIRPLWRGDGRETSAPDWKE